MKKTTKILLSIPSLIGMLYFLTYMYPTKFVWLFPDMSNYYVLTTVVNASMLAVVIIILRRLWKFKGVGKSKKAKWTWLLILFSAVTTLIYIWKIDDQLINENRTNG